MAEVTNIKPLVKEDFPSEYHDLIEKLAFSLNPFMRQVVAAFAGQIDFNNLAQATFDFQASVDASGIPLTPIQIKINPNRKIIGLMVIKIDNLTDDVNLTGSPFLTFSTSKTILSVNHITGLSANKNYRIRALILV